MRPSQNIPPFQHLYATLPESTPSSQNIPPFSTTICICDPPRIYPSLPEYTPLFNNYMRPSQNITPFSTTICEPPRIYPPPPDYTPLFNNYMRPSQNLPLPPRIYPLFNKYIRPSQNLAIAPRIYTPHLWTTICDPPRIYPSLPEYSPLFNKFLCVTVTESPPLSQNIHPPPPPFQKLYATLPGSTLPSQNIFSVLGASGRFSLTYTCSSRKWGIFSDWG